MTPTRRTAAQEEMDLINREGWMCEKHPGYPWPSCPMQADCPGPGMAWKYKGRVGRQAVEALVFGQRTPSED